MAYIVVYVCTYKEKALLRQDEREREHEAAHRDATLVPIPEYVRVENSPTAKWICDKVSAEASREFLIRAFSHSRSHTHRREAKRGRQREVKKKSSSGHEARPSARTMSGVMAVPSYFYILQNPLMLKANVCAITPLAPANARACARILCEMASCWRMHTLAQPLSRKKRKLWPPRDSVWTYLLYTRFFIALLIFFFIDLFTYFFSLSE